MPILDADMIAGPVYNLDICSRRAGLKKGGMAMLKGGAGKGKRAPARAAMATAGFKFRPGGRFGGIAALGGPWIGDHSNDHSKN